MPRPVDGDKLIETLKIMRDNYDAGDESIAASLVEIGVQRAYMSAIDAVQDAPTIEVMQEGMKPIEPIEVVDTAKHVNDDFRTLAWKCGACGSEIGGTDNYCHECGRRVKWE